MFKRNMLQTVVGILLALAPLVMPATETQQYGQQAEQPDYTVAAVEREMELAKQANVRSGPGTDYEVVATLDAGIGVRVTGEVQGVDWLRVDVLEGGGEAFIYAPLLKILEALPEAPIEPFGPGWAIVANQACQYWFGWSPEPDYTVTWSGACVDGKISGEGRLVYEYIGGPFRGGGGKHAYEGGMRAGKEHEQGTRTEFYNNKGWFKRYEGTWRDGDFHGRGTFYYRNGRSMSCDWVNGDKVTGSCN